MTDPKKSVEPPPSTSLPDIGVSEILGLVELLKSKGGREDIYKLAAELSMEYGETLSVIRGAETLSLVHTPGGDVVLESLGEQITKARVNGRKSIIQKQVRKLPVVEKVWDYLEKQADKEAPRDEVVEFLAELNPKENAEKTFDNLVAWGRYAEIFGYNDDSHMLYLDQDEAAGN